MTGQAADLIRERGWNKGSAYGKDGSLCLAMALNHQETMFLKKRISEWNAVIAAISSRYPDRGCCSNALHVFLRHDMAEISHDACISCFNDHPDTTEEDVLLVLKLAEETSGIS